jgi:hypothetical protein
VFEYQYQENYHAKCQTIQAVIREKDQLSTSVRQNFAARKDIDIAINNYGGKNDV